MWWGVQSHCAGVGICHIVAIVVHSRLTQLLGFMADCNCPLWSERVHHNVVDPSSHLRPSQGPLYQVPHWLILEDQPANLDLGILDGSWTSDLDSIPPLELISKILRSPAPYLYEQRRYVNLKICPFIWLIPISLTWMHLPWQIQYFFNLYLFSMRNQEKVFHGERLSYIREDWITLLWLGL